MIAQAPIFIQQSQTWTISERPTHQLSTTDNDETRRQASQFLERLQTQRNEHQVIAKVAANRNSDLVIEGIEEEL